MNSRWIIFILLLFFYSSSFAQKEGTNWYFGFNAGLNFNNGSPASVSNGKIRTKEGTATISDANGNLLFYTDGSFVYNRNHELMSNGTGLKGNLSTTQSAIIVPKPRDPLIYYIITVDKPDYTDPPGDPIEGVNYSVVDMSLNSGLGDIIGGQKNIHLITYNPRDAKENEFKNSEKVAAIAHGDCESFWVVTQFTNKFYAFKISSAGFDTNPVISTVPTFVPPTIRDELANKTGIGYMKFNTEGTKLAIAHSTTILEGGPRSGNKKNGKVLLYEFNDMTGVVAHERLILNSSYPYGLEFSPSGNMLYVAANIYDNNDVFLNGEVYQYDLSSQSISASQVILNRSGSTGGALQLALDGKIYKAGRPLTSQSHQFISVIEKPEEPGNLASFRLDKINIAPGYVELGLPQFIQSFLKIDFNAEFLCLGETTQFTVADEDAFDSLLWDFGDGTTSTNRNASHSYSNTGIYQVTVTRYINNVVKDMACRQITIESNPVIQMEYVLKQCDFNDSNPNDGLTDFNLQLAKDPVTMGDSATMIYFYDTYSKAVNDTENHNSLNVIFRNQSRDQIVFAKVTRLNSLCFDIAEVTLKTTDGITINPSPKYGCETSNGKADFDLGRMALEIKNEMGIPPSAQLSFHTSQTHAAAGNHNLPVIYSSGERKLFIRIDNENSCYGSGSVDIKIGSFPEIQQINEFKVCQSLLPVALGSEITLNSADYGFQWNTGQNSPQIEVNSGGFYSLRITDLKLGCEKILEFIVEELTGPEIVNVLIENNGTSSNLTIEVDSDSPASYSLDREEGPYQDDPFFNYVSPGEHIIYVKNESACEISRRKIFVFGYPTHFTPNNDGVNETWMPINVPEPAYRIVRIEIYDRYGKLLKQLDPQGNGWDGTFNGKPMPANDYWFYLLLQNGISIKSHFSLLR